MSISNSARVAVRRALVASAAASAALLCGLPTIALGQDAAEEDGLAEVVVTGTRIRTPGLTSNSPISSVSAEDLRTSQPVSVEEFFKTLPSAVPAIGTATNNGANGGATIDLRGLGANRNLVLMDGRRLTPFNLDGETNTNVIPLALLERVDLVTGGASAVYGADAVSGVANFILRKNFEGIEFSGQFGQSGQSDAERLSGDILLGANVADGRGNVVLAFGYTDINPLNQDERPIGLQPINSGTGRPDGSGSALPLRISAAGGAPIAGGDQINVATGAVVPTYSLFNFNPDNYYQTELQRYQTSALGSFEITPQAEVYAQLFYTKSNLAFSAAPSLLNSTYAVPIGNPYIPAAARTQICAAAMIAPGACVAGPAGTTEVNMTLFRRFTELGPRFTDFNNNWAQYTAGVRGDITDRWNYDAYFTRGTSQSTRTRDNWGSSSKVQQALRAFNTTTCTSTANGCVPLNVFGAEGSVTPAMVNFFNLDAISQEFVDQEVANASVSGDLGDTFKSPFAESPIGVAVGLEYRRVTAENKADGPTQIQGEVLGTGAPTPDRSGIYTLKEAFTELLVPIISDRPFINSLSLELGYRQTEFTTAASQDYGSYKYGGEWSPVEGLRFRAMKQRATRSPNVNELFQPPVSALSNLNTDPCQGARISAAQANVAGTLSNLCRLTGVPVAQIGVLAAPSAGQINVRQGGNANLNPEEADTTTVGFVFQPTFVDDLTISLDYYNIEINKAVSRPTATDILDACYSGNSAFAFNDACALVLRSPFDGSFNGPNAPGVVQNLSNAGFYETAGYDLGVTYGYAFSNERLGRLTIQLNANYVDKFDYQATPSAIRRDCVGFYSVACDTATVSTAGPRPEYRWNQRTTWAIGAFDFSYVWRHIAGMEEEPLPPVVFADFQKIDSFDYFDLAAGWNFSDTIRLDLSVNNVTDKDPPNVGYTVGGTGPNNGNTYPQLYDPIGRYFTLGFNVKF